MNLKTTLQHLSTKGKLPCRWRVKPRTPEGPRSVCSWKKSALPNSQIVNFCQTSQRNKRPDCTHVPLATELLWTGQQWQICNSLDMRPLCKNLSRYRGMKISKARGIQGEQLTQHPSLMMVQGILPCPWAPTSSAPKLSQSLVTGR